jgi:acyl carrier protein
MSSLTELQDLIQKKYGLEADAIDPDKPLLELGLDSLAIAEFLFEVEDHFTVRLTDDDPTIDTLRKLSALVDKMVAAKGPAPTSAASTASPP